MARLRDGVVYMKPESNNRVTESTFYKDEVKKSGNKGREGEDTKKRKNAYERRG